MQVMYIEIPNGIKVIHFKLLTIKTFYEFSIRSNHLSTTIKTINKDQRVIQLF